MNKKTQKDATTSSNFNIRPGSGFGFGTDKIDRKKDKLYQKRKKDLNNKQYNQLIGEEDMSSLATFTSNNRDAIGLQYSILDTYNHTNSDMWMLSPIESKGEMYSFTVKSVQPDQFFDEDVFKQQLVAGVSMKMSKMEKQIDVSESIAETLINAISNGSDSSEIVEAYLGRNTVEITESSDENKKADALRNKMLKMLRMSDDSELSDDQMDQLDGMMSKALEVMQGKKKQS